MTNLHVHSNSSDQTPVADVKERLAQILETVLQLQGNSEWFQAEAADLFSELRGSLKSRQHPTLLPRSTLWRGWIAQHQTSKASSSHWSAASKTSLRAEFPTGVARQCAAPFPFGGHVMARERWVLPRRQRPKPPGPDATPQENDQWLTEISRISELDADERWARHRERLQRRREAYRKKRAQVSP
jgi:hypothetical protein